MTTITNTTHTDQQFTHAEVIHAYGLFMIAWSVLESVVQTAIMKQLGVNPIQAVIVTGKLQFNPRVQLLCALLKLHGDKHKEVMKLLNKAEGFAHRNAFVHGLVKVGTPGQLTFVKYDGGNSQEHSFTAEQLLTHTLDVNDQVVKIQSLLQVTDAEMEALLHATSSMV